ncbi:MAG: TetR/AcrR family transcriptional regulator [Gordonia sp. (in: high G+C Gram-positive bacteria)]
MARTKPREQRRSELLDAARELFVTKGVAGTSMDDITRRAGVSKGLFYLYFRSKDDLIAALQEDFAARLAQRIAHAVAAEPEWEAKLDACVRASFDCYRELPELHEILFRHSVSRSSDADGAPPHELVSGVLRDLLVAGTAAGAYDVDDPVTTAGLLYIVMHAFDPGYHGDVITTDERLIRATTALFRRTAGVVVEG